MSNDPDQREETLWRHDIKKGWLSKKVVYSYLITNKRFVSGSQILNDNDRRRQTRFARIIWTGPEDKIQCNSGCQK